ncbi:hypothetical protein KP509_12G007300 [Ceratopteris richardii]|uniref:Vitamin K epoxide reductase domain-containing protein n=1 Tax=Ceratopteris richardii TaxID=49495 RepID=A0A8T2TKZ3_CERRI|nr:hypothetical protein KP509_12G007300 [Ceratopteris richardii]
MATLHARYNYGLSTSLSPLCATRQFSCILSSLFAGSSAAPLRNNFTAKRCSSQKQNRVISCSSQPEDKTEDNAEVPTSEGTETRGFQIDFGVIAGLGIVGFSETVYLTYMKLFGGPVSCPIGAGNCEDVLNSDYSFVFGVPLSAVGMLAYGSVAILGVLGASGNSFRIANVDMVRWLLLGTTSVMASASVYFMYILSTKLEGESCVYCVTSAVLSTSLLLLTLRKFGFQEIKQVAGLQLAAAVAVFLTLSSSYAGITPAATRSDEIDLPPVEPQITTSSSPMTISLAKHLQSIGAKMYGAFWCSHCYEQKQMFGREAMKYIDYVECYPDGYRRGIKMAEACESAKVDGFPTWIIKGEVLSGEQEYSEIARASGFESPKTNK